MDTLDKIFTAILKLVRFVMLSLMVLVVGCMGCVQIIHDISQPKPCEREGRRLGLTDIVQYTEEENIAGAYCSGRRNGRLVSFRAGGNYGF